MNKRVVIAIAAVMGAALILIALTFRQGTRSENAAASSVKSIASPPPQMATRSSYKWQESDQQMPAVDPNKYDPTLPQWQEWRRRNKEDKKWEWKTPISFYGEVIDQNQQPVVGAKVTLSWTDLSAAGTSLRELITDEAGKFSLSDVRGKHLLIRSIEKEGYEYAVTNRDGFEYSAFFDESYHIPDPKNPVIFKMHKKAEEEPLFVVSNKYRIPGNGTVAVDMKTGRLNGNDLLIELVDNSDPTGKRWVAKVRAPVGGIQAVNDEFATTAPESGYQPEVIINQDTPQPAGFQSGSLYKGGKFYVKTASGYALVEFRMIPGNKSIHFTSCLNPNPKSRNLEFDPAKAIKSP